MADFGKDCSRVKRPQGHKTCVLSLFVLEIKNPTSCDTNMISSSLRRLDRSHVPLYPVQNFPPLTDKHTRDAIKASESKNQEWNWFSWTSRWLLFNKKKSLSNRGKQTCSNTGSHIFCLKYMTLCLYWVTYTLRRSDDGIYCVSGALFSSMHN